jgi:hypothetical protein
MTHITRLEIRDYRGIKAMDIDAGDLNLFVGANAQGKTGILDAIEAAMQGKVPPDAVHHDAELAEIRIELSDGTHVRRRVPATGKQTVTVKKDRAKLTSPQSVLDALFAPEGFDPIAFIEAKDRQKRLLEALPVTTDPKEVLAYLKGVGLSKDDVKGLRTDSAHAFEVFEAVGKMLADERKGVNREVKQLAAWIKTERESLGEVEDPAEEIDALQTEKAKVMEAGAKALGVEQRIDEARQAESKAEIAKTAAWSDLKRERGEVASLERQLEAARKREQKANERHDQQTEQLGEAQSLCGQLKDEHPEIATEIAEMETEANKIDAEITVLKEKRGAYQESLKRAGAVDAKEAELEGKRARAKALDAGVKLFAKQAPAEALARTKMPVDGLEYRDGKFYVNGTHIDQLSGSETLNIAARFTVEKVRQKGLHVVCVDGLEKLGEKQRAEFFGLMREAGIQLWAAEVDHGQGVPDGDGVLYVVMSDGAPAEVKTTVTADNAAQTKQSGLTF